ncbi:MAG: methylmalonyl-CoA mutase family protein, partial [Planctomycetota bacterium]
RRRDGGAVRRSLDALKRACEGTDALVPPILDCVESQATVGEICSGMEEVFGEYREPR